MTLSPDGDGLPGVGTVIAGKYRIERLLGVGGMGVVAEATHLELDQGVALKFMLPRAMSSPTAAERFLREARAAVQLRSDHICRVLDVGRHDGGAPYIVMELLQGEDLMGLVLRTGPQPPARACEYVMQLLEGLADAHASSIVHRDLKPQNVFVTKRRDGRPLIKILDFGISKSALGGNTQTADVMGSPAYMSPEQMQSSKHVDARADIWSVGIILHQVISGQLPFEGDSLPALCVAVLNDTPPRLDALNPQVSRELAEVVARCLEKDPSARFQNVAELANALGAFCTGDAREAPARITKILGLDPASAASVAPTQLASRPVAAVASRPGQVSTLQRGAGQISPAEPRPSTSRNRLLLAGAAAVLVAAGVFVIAGRALHPYAAASARAPLGSQPVDGATASPISAAVDAGIAPIDAALADAAVADAPAPTSVTPKHVTVKRTAPPKQTVAAPKQTVAAPVTSPPPPPTSNGSAQQGSGSKWTRMQHDK